jgi:DNA processing protein
MRKSEAGWIALALTEHLGGSRLRALSRAFDHDIDAILTSDTDQLRRVHGIGPKIAASIASLQPAAIEAQMTSWEKAGVGWTLLQDTAYPQPLLALEDPPPIVFWRGIDGALSDPYTARVAIVGTREPGPEAAAFAEALAYGLAVRGALIVSGLALGVDAAAHLGALAAGGRTAAVLGGGVLNVYPPENRALSDHVLRCGVLLSETHPRARARTPSLVARNRIISGLADVVVVVESNHDGGAMHAARRALAQGKPVYVLALPASGNQHLLSEGALPLSPLATDAAAIILER